MKVKASVMLSKTLSNNRGALLDVMECLVNETENFNKLIYYSFIVVESLFNF